MTSSAFSAQGSTFKISSGVGSPVSITGIAVGYPTIITATGLSNGDVGAIAALTGADAAVLNGNSYPVLYSTGSKFAIDVNTTGKTITVGSGTFTPNAYTQIKNVKKFSGFDGKASILDATDLDSAAKEKLIGLQDSGKFSFDINIDYSDAGQIALLAAKASSARKSFKLTYPNGKVASFDAFVMSMPANGGVDSIVMGSVELEITGVITIA